MKYYKQSSTSVFLTLYIISHALTGYPVQQVEAVFSRKIQKIFVPNDNNAHVGKPNVTPSWNSNSSNSLSLTDVKLKEIGTSVFMESSKKLSQTYPQRNKTALDAATDAFFKENSKLAMDILTQETINVTDRYRCIASNDGKERITCLSVIVFSSISMSSVIVSFMKVKK